MLCLHCEGSSTAQVLERALRQAGSQFNTDAGNPTVGFVRLSGALHCDERSAFQEIAHQLCRWASNLGKAKTAHHLVRTCSTILIGSMAPDAHTSSCDGNRAAPTSSNCLRVPSAADIGPAVETTCPTPCRLVCADWVTCPAARSTSPSAAALALMTT